MINAAVEAVQEACSPRTWQLGRKLHEDGAVERIADRGAEEQVYRVWAPGRPVAPTATLYVEDEEWDCDCGSRLDCCEHAAAAAHALAAGDSQQAQASAGPRLAYRLRRRRKALQLERVWVDESGERPVEARLTERRAGVQGGFSPRESDIKIEQLLIATEGRTLPLETLPSLFDWLSRCEDLALDGRPCRVDPQPPAPRARLVAIEGGWRLRIEAPAGVDEVVADGVVRIGEVLHPLTHLRLIGAQMEALPLEREFVGDAVVDLITELLPQLQKGMDFDAGGHELPRLIEGVEVSPEIKVSARADAIELHASLVYGDPPMARLRAGGLEVLGDRWPKRDSGAEAKASHQLRARFELAPGEVRVERGAAGAELAAKLRAWGGRVRGRKALDRFGLELQPRFRSGGEGLAVDDAAWSLDFEAEGLSLDAETVMARWREGAAGVALPGGGWARLPQDFLAVQGERLADLIAAREAGGSSRAGHDYAAVRELCEALEAPLPPAYDRLRPLLENFESLPAARLPEDLEAELRSYQRRGVDWLGFARQAGLGAMLCDDMGLGKTLQALCAVEGPALVVAPTSLLHNWEKEAKRFRPGLEVSVYHGPKRELPAATDAAQLVITSYGVLRLDTEALAKQRWRVAILDEAQVIKNPDSQVARAAFELDAEFKITLSGTPVENRLDELWSQAHFTNPGMLGGREDFKDRWARPIAAGVGERAESLRAKLKPVMMRRLKREVAPELPPRTEITVHCELSEAERLLYEALRREARAEIEGLLSEGKNVLSALERLLRLRQAACHRALVPGQQADDSAKLRRLRAELDEAVAAGHKALVFSQWTSFLDLVEPGLRELGIDWCRLDGSTRDRGEVVDRFSADDGPPVMLLSLMAGGTGLNLTAADHVYFLDPWWNPAVEAQAADRAHRIGQDKPVLIHRLVARNTVDERILALQERKRALADAVVAEGGGGLSREDLLALLD